MKKNYLLGSETAKALYERVCDLPIYDYHCHLSPKEIYEDKQFEGIGQMWLEADHYKWRLMRASNVSEDFITGEKSFKEKFLKYISAVETAGGNPLYHWSQMELELYFNIDIPLLARNGEEILKKANDVIKTTKMSPKKLIKQANVKYIATTDDPADGLLWHEKLAEDSTFDVTVAPCFRTDNLLQLQKDGYSEYISRLSATAGIEIDSLTTLKKALIARLAEFKRLKCRMSDVGIPFFPNRIASENEADDVFKSALKGEKVDENALLDFIGHMYGWLGKLYKENDIVMQWHLAVYRNANTKLFEKKGADCGGDCINDPISNRDIIAMLDYMEKNDGLPQTVIYTLNPSMLEGLASIAGSFRGVQLGAAWWFYDNKKGIAEVMEIIARSSNIGGFLGMLTDSRSFLSYARHDYFRRILCTMLADWQDTGEFGGDIEALARRICCENIKKLIGEKCL